MNSGLCACVCVCVFVCTDNYCQLMLRLDCFSPWKVTRCFSFSVCEMSRTVLIPVCYSESCEIFIANVITFLGCGLKAGFLAAEMVFIIITTTHILIKKSFISQHSSLLFDVSKQWLWEEMRNIRSQTSWFQSEPIFTVGSRAAFSILYCSKYHYSFLGKSHSSNSLGCILICKHVCNIY